jgi:soluble lytic murein transglycosylase-like protein
MNLRPAWPLLILLTGIPRAASGQHWSHEDWRDLRHRLEYNLDLQGLFARRPFWRLKLDDRKEMVKQIACGLGMAPSLALALIEHESGFDQGARGQFGELGAAQVLPATARQYQLDHQRLATEFRYNVAGGLRILKSLLAQFPERVAVQAYNGGPAFASSPPQVQEKVRRYAAEVLARKEKYDGMQCN